MHICPLRRRSPLMGSTGSNHGLAAISSWKVDVNLASATNNANWNGSCPQTGTDLVMTSAPANGTIQPAQSTTFGFCTAGPAPVATKSSAWPR